VSASAGVCGAGSLRTNVLTAECRSRTADEVLQSASVADADADAVDRDILAHQRHCGSAATVLKPGVAFSVVMTSEWLPTPVGLKFPVQISV
jgi:hypothetical protein